jgi:DNA-binding NarL/FixJ family response regulator
MESSVVILEDDIVMGHLLKARVNAIEGFRCDLLFENPIQFLSGKHPVNIILLDISMPEMSGLEAIVPILAKYPEAAIIINTIRDDAETIFEAVKKGALGYLDKQTVNVNLEEVLHTVAGGGAYMTPVIARRVFNFFQSKKNEGLESLTQREKNVVSGILEGLSYKMIAERNDLSINTVRAHVKRIYKKLNINSKGELFRISRE